MNKNDDILVEVKKLSFQRGSRVIYNDLNVSIKQGQITAIMGPSGIGKTTLLKLIGAQLYPDSGETIFAGRNMYALNTSELYLIREKIGMLFQSSALFTDMTVFDNVAFVLREHTKLSEELIRMIVLMKLESVGLRGAADLMPAELSGGMARRVALARAIVLDPELIMYDEPFAGQDPINMGILVSLIKRLNNTLNLTSIVVSHDVDAVLSIADYAYIIAEQKIIAGGTPEELANSDDPRVVQFLNGYADGPVQFNYPAEDYIQELLNAN